MQNTNVTITEKKMEIRMLHGGTLSAGLSHLWDRHKRWKGMSKEAASTSSIKRCQSANFSWQDTQPAVSM